MVTKRSFARKAGQAKHPWLLVRASNGQKERSRRRVAFFPFLRNCFLSATTRLS